MHRLIGELCQRVTGAARRTGDISGGNDEVCFHLLAAISAIHGCAILAPAAADQATALRSLATAAAALVPHCAPLLQHGLSGGSASNSPVFACFYQTDIAGVQLQCMDALTRLLQSPEAQPGGAELAANLLDAAPGWLPWLSALTAVASEEPELEARGLSLGQSSTSSNAEEAATQGE